MKEYILSFLKRNTQFLYERPILYSCTISIIISFVILLLWNAIELKYPHLGNIIILIVPLFLLVLPIILTILNLFFLIRVNYNQKEIDLGKRIEIFTIFLGIILSVLYLCSDLADIAFEDWSVQLSNSQVHIPIAKEMLPTIIVIALVATIGYIILRFIPLMKLSPLVIVLSIAAMYLGMAEGIIWSIQLFKADLLILILLILPFNCIIIAMKTIKEVIVQWRTNYINSGENEKYDTKPLLRKINKLLYNSANWPWIAFALSLPMLGILICILTLFGQSPDSIIKAWTETADWNLSKRIAPQNVMLDEHYLCTVAAGGHPKIVKPIRLGKRHGHEVIVNRQLCIANAFEQILEIKTPKFHKFIRYIYDTCGYPFAKHIHSPYAADIIYFIMKPLEWIFLAVIYICDTNPENRIAVQYLPISKK